MKKALYTYAILLHDDELGTQIIKDITSVLANSDEEVKIIAAREIPKKLMDDVGAIEIIVSRYSPTPVYQNSWIYNPPVTMPFIQYGTGDPVTGVTMTTSSGSFSGSVSPQN